MTTNITDTIEIIPKAPADASIIWMHGLGASGDDFLPIIDQFNLPNNHSIRFIFPNAPIKPITINNGMKMRAWYNIKHFDEFIHNDDTNDNHEGIKESQLIINNLIKREIEQNVNSKRIVLAGFRKAEPWLYILDCDLICHLEELFAYLVTYHGTIFWPNKELSLTKIYQFLWHMAYLIQ